MDIRKLKEPLDLSNVSQRDKGNTKLSYVESWYCIAKANEVFGFEGWSSETLRCEKVCEYPYTVGKGQWAKEGFKVGYEAVVRVTVRFNDLVIVKDGVGNGSGIAGDLFDAIEGASKEAESDAQKRALRMFGNQFGLCLYNKGALDVSPPAPPNMQQAKQWLIDATTLDELGAAWGDVNSSGHAKALADFKETKKQQLMKDQ